MASYLWNEGRSSLTEEERKEAKKEVSITDSGRTTADFHSYFSCNLENCDLDAMEGNLYWDHAGKERADLTGELLTEDSPLVVSDGYCKVTVLPKNFLIDEYVALALTLYAKTQGYESDLECPVPLIGLTLEITIDYSEDQASCVKHFEEASAHHTSADSYFQEGDLDNALSEYQEAKIHLFPCTRSQRIPMCPGVQFPGI